MAFSFSNKLIWLTVFFLVSCSQISPPTTISNQGEWISSRSVDYCSPQSGLRVVDTSSPITAPFIARMQEIGVEVVARYYGYTSSFPPPDGSVVSAWQSNKVIGEIEVDLLRISGMNSIAVFQYQSDQEKTFRNWPTRSVSDADRALQLAVELGQPRNTTIYFGADGDFVNGTSRSCEPFVTTSGASYPGNCSSEVQSYFGVVAETVRRAGYEVGVYGSGATCRLLTENGLVDRCWLNFSSGHTGREWGLSSDATVLRQLTEAKGRSANQVCGGRDIDANWILNSNFGQFSYR